MTLCPPRPRALPAALALALALAACGSSGPVGRVRVPIAESPVGAAKAEACVATCRAHNEADVAAYGRCLAECPGAEIEYGQRCRAVREGPRAACAEMAMRRPRPERPTPASSGDESSDDGEGGGWLAGLLGAIIGGAVESAVEGKRGSSSRSASHEEAQAAPTATPARAIASPSRVAAAPSKDHAKASPSRGSSSSSKEKKRRAD